MTPDFVYLCKDVPSEQDELRYSMRSAETAVPDARVWLVGGRPEWTNGTPLGHVKTVQASVKFINTRQGVKAAVGCDEISDPFILMNDDFFIMKAQRQLRMLHGGPFGGWLAVLRSRVGRSSYVRGGEDTLRILRAEGLPTVCWSLHTPLLVYKEAMRDALDLAKDHPKQIHVRTLYGNIAELSGVLSRDVKIIDRRILPHKESLYVSTSDGSFTHGEVGKMLRARFPTKSRFERD